MKLIVTIEAESDMREISAYTFAQWGMEQAITYIDQIESAFLKLLDAPHIGIDCSDIRLGYRQWVIQHHVIYYQATEITLTIIRVLKTLKSNFTKLKPHSSARRTDPQAQLPWSRCRES